MNQYSSMATYPRQSSDTCKISSVWDTWTATSHFVTAWLGSVIMNMHVIRLCGAMHEPSNWPWLAIVIIHQYLQKITNLTRIYHRTGSWNLHNLEIGSINFELPYIRQLWMFLFKFGTLIAIYPAYLELLHIVIHQLDREIGTLFWDTLYQFVWGPEANCAWSQTTWLPSGDSSEHVKSLLSSNFHA